MATERRLIDANKLAQKVNDDINQCYKLRIDGVGALSYFLDEINEQPTVDAMETVHSQWDTVFHERNGTLASYSHLCPECKYFYRDTKFKGHNFCPNCGAKMDRGGTYNGAK